MDKKWGNDGVHKWVDYFYNEDGEDKFVKIANSLTEFLINRLEMNEKLFKPVY